MELGRVRLEYPGGTTVERDGGDSARWTGMKWYRVVSRATRHAPFGSSRLGYRGGRPILHRVRHVELIWVSFGRRESHCPRLRATWWCGNGAKNPNLFQREHVEGDELCRRCEEQAIKHGEEPSGLPLRAPRTRSVE